jgi:hypothetical protein
MHARVYIFQVLLSEYSERRYSLSHTHPRLGWPLHPGPWQFSTPARQEREGGERFRLEACRLACHAYSLAAQSLVAVPKVALPGRRLLAKVPGRAVTSYPGPGDPARSLNTLPLPNRGPFPTLKDRRQGFSADVRKMARGQTGRGEGGGALTNHKSIVKVTRPGG